MRRSSPRSSPRSSAGWLRGCLQRDSGVTLDRTVDCDSTRTLGRNLTRCAAGNSTRSCPRYSPRGGEGSGGSSRLNNLSWSSEGSMARDFGSNRASYGGSIGGVKEGIGARGLGIGKLGRKSAVCGRYTIMYIRGWRAYPQIRRSSGLRTCSLTVYVGANLRSRIQDLKCPWTSTSSSAASSLLDAPRIETSNVSTEFPRANTRSSIDNWEPEWQKTGSAAI